MSDHRVRLDDYSLGLVVAALRARAAGLSGVRRRDVLRLAERLSESSPGNPFLRFEWRDDLVERDNAVTTE